jgi:hypothetical protein
MHGGFYLFKFNAKKKEILMDITHFCLSQWIWSFTWGLYHVPLAILFMIILTKCFTSLRLIPTLVLSVSGPLVAFLTTLLIGIFFICGLGFSCPSSETQLLPTCSILATCLLLAAIYSGIQLLFFAFAHRFYSLNSKRLTIITLLSHFITALIMSVIVAWHYR